MRRPWTRATSLLLVRPLAHNLTKSRAVTARGRRGASQIRRVDGGGLGTRRLTSRRRSAAERGAVSLECARSAVEAKRAPAQRKRRWTSSDPLASSSDSCGLLDTNSAISTGPGRSRAPLIRRANLIPIVFVADSAEAFLETCGRRGARHDAAPFSTTAISSSREAAVVPLHAGGECAATGAGAESAQAPIGTGVVPRATACRKIVGLVTVPAHRSRRLSPNRRPRHHCSRPRSRRSVLLPPLRPCPCDRDQRRGRHSHGIAEVRTDDVGAR